MGAAATAAWLGRRGLDASRTPHWHVEIQISADGPLFELNIYPEEWGIVLRDRAKVSSVRVTDIPFVHGLDDFRLVTELPELERIRDLLERLERRLQIQFQYEQTSIRSNLARAEAVVRAWLDG